MRNQFVALSLTVFLAVPALADATASAAPAQPGAAATTEDDHLDEMSCRKQPAPTGSRIAGKTVCMTNREWLAVWNASKSATQDMQNKPMDKMPGN
jgi:hypothetical protein